MSAGAAAIGFGAAALGMGIAGDSAQSNAEQNAAQFESDIAQQNAGFARYQAAEDARRFRVMTRQQLGETRAAYAASGVTNEGSAMEVMEQSARDAELDRLTILHEGEMRVRDFQTQSSLALRRKKASADALPYQTASRVLNFGSQVASYAKGSGPKKGGKNA